MSGQCIDAGVWVVIPAAGVGSRMESHVPKQYLNVHSKTILEHTIGRFLGKQFISGILVLIGENDSYWPEIEMRFSRTSSVRVAIGGAERADTVSKGLNYLSSEIGLPDSQWVMVHDAARPCLRDKDLLKLLEVRDSDLAGGILAVPAKDTMKRAGSDNYQISHTESREQLWHALTPQLFRLGELSGALKAAAKAGAVITDEASAMEFVGKSVALVEGTSDNIKLTTPSDLPLIEFLLQQRDFISDV